MGPAMGSIGKVAGPSLIVAAVIAISFGIGLTLKMRAASLDNFFVTGWGWAILIGFVTAMIAFVLGVVQNLTVVRLGRLMAGAGGGPPNPAVAAQAGALMSRLRLIGRTAAILVVIALGAMASARFV
jgi:hypothetical protein